jgi:predicted NAD/FAD-dependent oxidoreductase
MRVGVVGAGIAGLACADGLVRCGHEVVLFDKGRGPGGRMSTRRIETACGLASFDHGAQYFTVRDNGFRAQVDAWTAAGVVAPWPAAGSGAYVGVPGMNAPVRDLSSRHRVHWSTRVTSIERRGAGWRLGVEDGQSHEVELLVVAIPAEQAAALLVDVAPDLASRAAAAISEPCWTVMAAFSEPVGVSRDCWAAADLGEGALGWVARNSAKPGRTGPEAWVAQATPEWSRRVIDTAADPVAEQVLAALAQKLGVEVPTCVGISAHLWRFARCADGGTGPVFDSDRRLGLCGDWLVGPRVESAWISGADLAERIGAQT